MTAKEAQRGRYIQDTLFREWDKLKQCDVDIWKRESWFARGLRRHALHHGAHELHVAHVAYAPFIAPLLLERRGREKLIADLFGSLPEGMRPYQPQEPPPFKYQHICDRFK